VANGNDKDKRKKGVSGVRKRKVFKGARRTTRTNERRRFSEFRGEMDKSATKNSIEPRIGTFSE
jgi:hypothetical protein